MNAHMMRLPLSQHPSDPVHFIVIGAMRAATTTLYRYFMAHPEIGTSREKETDFFVESLNYDRGIAWYESLFPKNVRIRGECSPNYAKSDIFPGVPARIKAHIPHCKIIYVVRDPLARAVSQYRFHMGMGTQPEEAVAAKWPEFASVSCYHKQITAYMQHFDSENIHILAFEDLLEDPLPVLNEIGAFLGVSAPWTQEMLGAPVNSATELSRMPRWFFRLREIRLVSDIRRMMPVSVRNVLRTALATRPARSIPDLDPRYLEKIRSAVAEDARAFRRLTGRDFAQWTV